MKSHLISEGVAGTILIVSLCFAQNRAESEKSATKVSHDYSELTSAPEKARVRANPFQNDPDAAVAGQLLFEDHCAECHGNSGVGGKKGPTLRAAEVQNATPGTLFWLITNGVVRKGMPVWSKLPEAQRWQLVRYIKSLGLKSETSAEKP
jgi:mono/diheme cytochrome c family protein